MGDKLPMYWRFKDLRREGIVANRTTLRRWISRDGFPPGVQLGRAVRAYRVVDVLAWCDAKQPGVV